MIEHHPRCTCERAWPLQALAVRQLISVPIPESVLPIWTLVYDETVWVNAYWKIFNQLFGGPQDQLDLLNRSAGFCFYVIKDALATDIQLTLCKLSDPAESSGKTNATAKHLRDEIKKLGSVVADGLDDSLETFTNACGPLRNARNKMIAHLDRTTVIGTGQVKSVPSTTKAEVDKAVHALCDFTNAAAKLLGEAHTAFQLFITRGEGGDDLMALLRMAERYQDLQRQEKISWDDLPSV